MLSLWCMYLYLSILKTQFAGHFEVFIYQFFFSLLLLLLMLFFHFLQMKSLNDDNNLFCFSSDKLYQILSTLCLRILFEIALAVFFFILRALFIQLLLSFIFPFSKRIKMLAKRSKIKFFIERFFSHVFFFRSRFRCLMWCFTEWLQQPCFWQLPISLCTVHKKNIHFSFIFAQSLRFSCFLSVLLFLAVLAIAEHSSNSPFFSMRKAKKESFEGN